MKPTNPDYQMTLAKRFAAMQSAWRKHLKRAFGWKKDDAQALIDKWTDEEMKKGGKNVAP